MSARELPDPASLDPEDAKLVVLARTARSRTEASEGAAVRDTDGRTYTAATVDLPSLRLTALQAAVAVAAGSGARGLEAAAVVGAGPVSDVNSLAAVRDLGADAPVLLADETGQLVEVLTAGALES